METIGQTFFQAAGDGDAYTQPMLGPADSPNVTSCGGTVVTMDPTSSYFVSEVVWNAAFQVPGWNLNGGYTIGTNKGGYWGSGGGVSTTYSIPSWQQAPNLSAVGGSTSQRNIPDVALTGDNVWVVFFNGLSNAFEGTSIAAPLWAGFTALANEQAADHGQPSVGFLNPAFYIIGQSANYSTVFHDTTVSNNFWPNSPNKFAASTGYDLCTGWGTPNGQAMIDALAEYGGQIWVNFSGACPGNGNFTNAFCTLAQGINAVAPGGTICLIGPNSSSVTLTIIKPMTLRAFFGPVTIGQ
jgi:subtilase family serine protease